MAASAPRDPKRLFDAPWAEEVGEDLFDFDEVLLETSAARDEAFAPEPAPGRGRAPAAPPPTGEPAAALPSSPGRRRAPAAAPEPSPEEPTVVQLDPTVEREPRRASAGEIARAGPDPLKEDEPAVEPCSAPLPPHSPAPSPPRVRHVAPATAPAVLPRSLPTPRPPADRAAAAPAAAAPRLKIALTPLAGIVLGLVAAFNLALVAVTWRSLSSVRAMVLEMGQQVIGTAETIRAETAERAQRYEDLARPIVAPAPEGYLALESAADALERGEFERARESLYALLAVIDRLEPGVREDVEARASFLIADSWRLEADGAEASAGRGGAEG